MSKKPETVEQIRKKIERTKESLCGINGGIHTLNLNTNLSSQQVRDIKRNYVKLTNRLPRLERRLQERMAVEQQQTHELQIS